MPSTSSSATTEGYLSRMPSRPTPLRANLNLARELAITSFRLKYADSFLGYVWSLAKPLLIFGMMYLVFALFLLHGLVRPGENFAVELLVGVVLWTFFADATGGSLQSVLSNADMLKKAVFPRWILVVANTASAGMTLVVNLTLVLIVGIGLHWYTFGLSSVVIVPVLLEFYLLALGAGFLLASVNVYFRDLGHIWEVALQLLFFASAVVFPLSVIPPNYHFLALVNPVAQIVEDARRSIVSTAIPWSWQVLGVWFVIPMFIVVVTFVAGVVVFARLARRFGEHL